MSSYTALSALSVADAPEFPRDRSGEGDTQSEVVGVQDETQAWLPPGAASGNVVHELLEKIAFPELANGRMGFDVYRQSCQRYGLPSSDPQALAKLLRTVVTVPLSAKLPDFCLMNIPEAQCSKEMPFYLSMPTLATRQVNAVLASIPTFQALGDKAMRGFLTGFIDLVCCYQQRYYVMDYKTNCLPDYSEASLVEAMRSHNYGLQYWLYALVLHRYLQNRLPGYRYDRHFGGVRYLFVRGMRSDQPRLGVFSDKPGLARLEALARVFDGGAA